MGTNAGQGAKLGTGTPNPADLGTAQRLRFKLNINHPLIRPKWDAFKSTKGLGQYGMTDDLRREFEETVLASKYMQKCMEQEQRKIGAVEHQFIRMAYSEEKQAAG